MTIAGRLLGLSSRFQPLQRCRFQKTLALDTLLGGSQEAAGTLADLRGRAGHAVQVDRVNCRVALGEETRNWYVRKQLPRTPLTRTSTLTKRIEERWGYQQGAVKGEAPVDDIQPQGVFRGHTEENRKAYPVTGHLINFELNPAVPFTTLLLLDAATQGLCKFEGRQLRGEFFDPDVRRMARATPVAYNQPWPAFAKALPEFPYVSFDIVTDTEEDAKAFEAALQPYVKRIVVFDQAEEELPRFAG